MVAAGYASAATAGWRQFSDAAGLAASYRENPPGNRRQSRFQEKYRVLSDT
jgi:hypothetical protein